MHYPVLVGALPVRCQVCMRHAGAGSALVGQKQGGVDDGQVVQPQRPQVVMQRVPDQHNLPRPASAPSAVYPGRSPRARSHVHDLHERAPGAGVVAM